jgi:hypothetical protein
VLEGGERPGGRIVRIERGNGDYAEGGGQGIHSNYTHMFGLLRDVGLFGDLLPGSGRGKAVFVDKNGGHRVSGGNADMMRIVGVRGAADLLRYRTLYYTFRKRMAQYEIHREAPTWDNMSAAEAMAGASEAFFDFVLRPQTHAQVGTSPETSNIYHVANLLRLRLTTTASCLRTGNVTLCERLAERVPVNYGVKVAGLLINGERVVGVELEDGRTMKAKHVVVATTVGDARSILPDAFKPARDFMNGFNNSPLPLVFLFLDRPLEMEPYAFFAHPLQPDAIFNMALNHARKTPYMVPSGKAIVSAWPAYPGGATLISRPDSEIIAQALKDLAPVFPGIADWVDEAYVQRHEWGLARYAPGDHHKLLEFKRYSQTLQGVSFAGSDYDAVHMESGARNGARAAQRALTDALS